VVHSAARARPFSGFLRYAAGVLRKTDSIVSNTDSRGQGDWMIVVALECLALGAWPQRFSLSGMSKLSIAWGPERTVSRSGGELRFEFQDRWMSQNHACMVRTGDRWTFVDNGSRNGSRVNGERITREPLKDGDVIHCGGTFLVLRRTSAEATEPKTLAEMPEALRTVSPELGREFSVLPKIAASALPLLVLGESGTGKEGTVNAVHALSGRDGPLVAVNCGAIPATLIESELYGSRRGAFSGAQDRVGLVRTADRGTLFLDEMAELPVSSQAALLRLLQEKEIRPLGCTKPLDVDVRVIAATNHNVTALVEDGKLRRDLYARLSGYELRMPPLRERLEDLGMLVGALIKRHDKQGGNRTLTPGAAAALFAYPWPLNIRQLEQCLSAAVTLTSGEIGEEHLPKPVREARHSARASAFEHDRLVATLEKHNGNLSKVARELATSRSQLYRLLARHSIQAYATRRPTTKTP